ncbi:MAG: HAD-IA family hydrolase [Aquificota bacterium]
MPQKIIIFDVDGVIIDVSKTYHVAIKKTVESYLNREIPLEEIKKYKFGFGINNDYYASYAIIAHLKYGVPYEEIKKLSKECKNAVADCLRKQYNLPLTVEEVTQTFIRFFDQIKDDEVLLIEPFVFEWLKRKKYKLGVLTGRPKADVEYSFKKFNLLDKFDVIVHDDTLSDISLKKPNPYALKYTLDLLGAKKETEKYYIGDTISDLSMATEYKTQYNDRNLTYIHCNFTEEHKRENLKGDITFYHPEELKNFLLEI